MNTGLQTVQIDQVVAAADGWSNLAGNSVSQLRHGIYATKQGECYTISEPARRTVLDRLPVLNQQRYAEEVKSGLRDEGTKKGKSKKLKSPSGVSPQSELLPTPQIELFE